MPRVASEAILQVEYDQAKGWLFVRFASGEWYAYLDVPPEVFDAFIAAGSKGHFFQTCVRDRYPYQALP